MDGASRCDEEGKKTLGWMTTYGRIEVEEQVFRLGREGRELRPFATAAGVANRSYSRPLQRVMTDFGAEESFERAAGRILEHYKIDVSRSAIRRVTLEHAMAMEQEHEQERRGEVRAQGRGAEIIIAQMDGTMVPIVTTEGADPDGRKNRVLKWEEMRLALAHEHGSVTPRYGATMGEVEEAGAILLDCVARVGATADSFVHCVGDAAAWIERQVRAKFGTQGRYLVDFYHVSEYVAAAAPVCAPEAPRVWVSQQKEALLENRVEQVLDQVAPYVEGPECESEQAPVRACHRYLTNHREHLDYQGAKAAGLPIGSGEIEASHRSVLQQRLKLSGAWWLTQSAQKMGALRVHRANGEWNSYWENLRRAA